MTFDEILTQVVELLQRQGRVSYGALKRRFALDDDYLQDLKDELIDAQQLARDKDGKVLVWVGASPVPSFKFQVSGSQPPIPNPQSPAPSTQTRDPQLQTLDSSRGAREAERRQLTVMFCDLVGSTALSAQLDPEELREVVRAYQETCTEVIQRYDGQIAQHLGDGLLVYFGYPAAHEDDAHRAIRVGLDMLTALHDLNKRLRHPLQVRIGIHTGLVVVGEIGSGAKREILALGETPNLAARLQALAAPDTVVISAATQRLTAGLFTHRSLGLHEPKGLTTPLAVYQILGESGAQSRFDVAVQAGLTPLVGREEELALLRRRWEQATEGEGQVVLLSGEAGIGKSRLVQELKDHVAQDSAVRIEFRCSPYHHNSAFYPLIEHVQQVLHFAPSDTPHAKVQKLEQTLARYCFPQRDTVPLLAALLSLPHPETVSPLTLTPQQQKQKTLDALVHWLFEEAERAPVYTVWEDLHWADPSTLEFLALCLDQVPTARMLMLLTFRPEFTPAWASRSHVSHLVLSRLGRKQTSAIVGQLTGGKALPSEVLHQIVAKTDGVPLFVEELTKMVVEAETDGGARRAVPLPLGIPSTLQDALMARLDRLGTAKEVAQQGAVVGRELPYELLSAVSALPEAALQQELTKLVEAELLYQRGRPPQATYLFKHALVQETAYQSLLKSTRQQYHHQIAQVFEARFPETTETQPELVANHYTEAGLGAQAIPYWQRAGERAVQRSANAEAITHLTKGLELLAALPDTPERSHQELTLRTALGPALIATKGNAAPEVEQTYARAVELCRQVGETSQLFPVLFGLRSFYLVRAELLTAHELGEQLLSLAQSMQDSALLLEAQLALGNTLFLLGEPAPARPHLEQGIALYDPQHHRSHAVLYGAEPGMLCLFFAARVLWILGYPDQARKRSHEALSLVQESAQPYSLAAALIYAATLHRFLREGQATQERTEAAIALSTEQGFSALLAQGIIFQGSALAEQGQRQEGVAQMRQGLAALRATGAEAWLPFFLALLAKTYGEIGQAEEGLTMLTEALTRVEKTRERFWEAELYRLKGELLLNAERGTLNDELKTASVYRSSFRIHRSEEAEACFLKAIEIACKQQAKSLELRAVMSLSRLWQQQGKREEARRTLAEIYGWFTEGFDTKDLQEAKVLLQELT